MIADLLGGKMEAVMNRKQGVAGLALLVVMLAGSWTTVHAQEEAQEKQAWISNLGEAKQKAEKSGKPLFIYVLDSA